MKYYSDQPAFLQMQTVFEEMWVVSLELQIVTYPVVNAATAVYSGYPNFEIGTDMD